MNLSAEMAKLPEPVTTKQPPHWEHWRWDLWERAQEDKPENFTKWPCVYHTMLVDHWWPGPMQSEIDYINSVFGVSKTEIDYVRRKFASLKPAQPTYAPTVHVKDDSDPDSRNLTHQLYHLLRWQEVTGKRIADMQTIYEFGGGYGAMALVANRLGFKGKYYIYDLPEFALLQQWYLEQQGVNNVEWRQRVVKQDVDLMIACYSLSETTIEQRDAVLSKVNANNYLFLYSAKWEEYNNQEYFSGLDFGKTWAHEHIKHLPPESWYTWGW